MPPPVAVLGAPRLRVRPPPPNLLLGAVLAPCSASPARGLRAAACAARRGWSSLACSHRSGSSRRHGRALLVAWREPSALPSSARRARRAPREGARTAPARVIHVSVRWGAVTVPAPGMARRRDRPGPSVSIQSPALQRAMPRPTSPTYRQCAATVHTPPRSACHSASSEGVGACNMRRARLTRSADRAWALWV